MSDDDEICTDCGFADWPMCTVTGCPNRCCLRLNSDKCYPHTMLGPDADPHLLSEAAPVASVREGQTRDC